MAENSGDLSLGYMMGQSENNGGGFFGGDSGWLGIVLLALLFGWGGGGMGFGNYGGGMGMMLNGIATRADINEGFALNNITGGITAVQQGICDSTYALNNTITSGFHGVDNAICNLGYNVQSGINAVQHQISDCCCTTQRAIDGVNYNMAKGFCDLGNVLNMQTRDIIDNQNANYRGLMDFLVQEKLSSKDAKIAELNNALSQSNQNAVIRAAIDASTAEIIRRTGNECPVPAYVVPNPNCCYGNPLGVGYGFNGANQGCGCGC